MQTLLKYKFTIIGLLMGALAGYAYYYFVGCASGTCSITSSPVNSTLYGAMMGGIFLHSFETENKN
jgi:hypothetical protein